ncbi:unnamed protein product [Schistosoma turkestanicum]|nr:unnamed protein product [Schistosoma turkestanicum]
MFDSRSRLFVSSDVCCIEDSDYISFDIKSFNFSSFDSSVAEFFDMSVDNVSISDAFLSVNDIIDKSKISDDILNEYDDENLESFYSGDNFDRQCSVFRDYEFSNFFHKIWIVRLFKCCRLLSTYYRDLFDSYFQLNRLCIEYFPR